MLARNSRWLGLLLALLFSLPCWADLGPGQALRRAMQAAVDEGRVAGCVLVVMEDGQTVFHEAHGLADRATSRPMRTDSLFRLASVSKPLVSAAALRLVQDGRLLLQDPVDRYLPWFQPHAADGSRPEITVHHLLTHTSGLSYRYAEPAASAYHALGISDGLDQPWLSLEDNLRRLSQAPLGFRPGEKFNYGLSTDVLGAVLEKASGLSLPEVMDRLILGPLELRDTAFHAVDIERLTTPYGKLPFRAAGDRGRNMAASSRGISQLLPDQGPGGHLLPVRRRRAGRKRPRRRPLPGHHEAGRRRHPGAVYRSAVRRRSAAPRSSGSPARLGV